MRTPSKSILELTSSESMDFLLKSEQYHSFELPEYFDFEGVLNYAKSSIGDKKYEECISQVSVSSLKDVNLDILLNKDGRYAVRPIVLCNPFLYYFLVREMCHEDNWTTIKEHFKNCTVPHIRSCAMPIVPQDTEKFYKEDTILNWWNSMEQKAIELSLQYRYMFVSDITNCYGSVNPQTIDWALNRLNTKSSIDTNHQLAKNIIRCLADLQQGRNIGIPQGSTAFDLTGEIILSYSDLLLHESLEAEGITDGYETLRYRDDYKIFCNDRDILEKISYKLQHVLEGLNFRLNSSKTFISDSVITDSIKSDKLYYIANTPIFNKKGCDFDGIQKHLLYILMFGRKFPNGGQLRTMLNQLDERIIKLLKPKKKKKMVLDPDSGKFKKIYEEEEGEIKENIFAMSAIATQIAIENVSITHFALKVISRMVNSMSDIEKRDEIIELVQSKLVSQPNSTYSQLWLQNMTYKQDSKLKRSPYNIRLCKAVMGENVQLWNNSWLKDEYTKDFPQTSVVNKEVLAKVDTVIRFREKRRYEESFLLKI